jgi:hypothetical protein
MLNRKLSNYIYYGVVAFVVVLIFIIRIIAVGSINGKIEKLEKDNVTLQKQITDLNVIVQDNSTAQSAQIFDLYKQMPSVYSGDTLSNKVFSKLERLGITEAVEVERSVIINDVVSLSSIEQLKSFNGVYGFVELQISFNTNDANDVYNFLDSMNDDDQLFVLNRIFYAVPEVDEFVTVSISYFAFYDDVIIDPDE